MAVAPKTIEVSLIFTSAGRLLVARTREAEARLRLARGLMDTPAHFDEHGNPYVSWEKLHDALFAGVDTSHESPGALSIAGERTRQITEEGYTAERDAGRADELAEAAQAYEVAAHLALIGDGALTEPPPGWPWADEHWKPTGDPVSDLTKAGALIAAAIDAALAVKGEEA